MRLPISERESNPKERQRMFVAYKGFRIVESAENRAFEVRDAHGRTLGRFSSMSAAVEAINRMIGGGPRRVAS